MKYLTILPDLIIPIPYYDPDGTLQHKDQSMTHQRWLMALVDDPELCKTPKDIRLAIKLEQLFAEATCVPGAVIALEDSDKERLQRIYEKPSGHYNPIVARATVAYMDAWEAMTDTKPKNTDDVDTKPDLQVVPPANGVPPEVQPQA